MPDSRTDSLVQLAQDTARRITGSHTAWMAYLQTAARLYKYPYHEQLLIFAQRPQATACAGYEVWKIPCAAMCAGARRALRCWIPPGTRPGCATS